MSRVGASTGRPSLGRRFWLVWTAATVSTLGDGIRYVAFPLLAADLTRDPRGVAIVSAAGYLPWPLLGLVGGAVVDRVDRRRLMWRVDLARAVLVAGFAGVVVTQSAAIALLAAVTFVLGVAETFFDNASSAILPMLVDDAALERANSWLMSSQMLMAILIGAPIGSLIFDRSHAAPLVVDAVTFAVAAVLIAEIGGSYSARAVTRPSRIGADIREGLRWLWQQRLLRALCLLLAVMNAALAAGEAVLVLYALDVLRIGNIGYSLLLATLAVGGISGALLATRIRARLGFAGTIAFSAIGQAVSLAVAGMSSSVVVAAAGLLVFGGTGSLWNVVTVSLRQRLVPAELLGRVTSSYRVVGLSAMPIGAALGGVLAKAYGLHAPYLVGALALLVASALCLPVVRAHRVTAAAASSG